MVAINWLHLTDLHVGMKEQQWLWPNVRHKFFEDLKYLHEQSGPWDLVFFTGDLTQRGSIEEFKKLDEILGLLWDHMRSLGSDPSLLAVPGNHDLERPGLNSLEALALGQWHNVPEIQDEFWEDPDCQFRKIVDQAFNNYEAWWERCLLRGSLELQPGLLPGEFSTSFVKDGVSIGILGINIGFLQITGNEYKGKLALHPSQFHVACGGDGPKWADEHDLCLLLTHQPPDWLNSDSLRCLNGEVASPGRFALHLYGHMHKASVVTEATAGAESRHFCQGSSLFGFERWGNPPKEDRRHGYSAGRIDIKQNAASLSYWPRRLRRHAQGEWDFVPDNEAFTLRREDNLSTAPQAIPINTLKKSTPPDAEPSRPVSDAVQPGVIRSSGVDPANLLAEPSIGVNPVENPESKISLNNLSEMIQQQTRLLEQFGSAVLLYLCSRTDPSRPIPLAELAQGLINSPHGESLNIPTRELAQLLDDAQNRGCVPGLAKDSVGYWVEEEHLAFKSTRETEAKHKIAKSAVRMIRSGMNIGIDGGSTTLPIIEQFILTLDSDDLREITIVTNSIPIVQRLGDFLEMRGWSDNSPVKVLICAGLVRPNTKAIADILDGASEMADSLRSLIRRIGGLDYCFIGANGLTENDGITMPTPYELPPKLILLQETRDPYIVADSSKFGQRYGVKIADWDSSVSVLTNRPSSQNKELDAIMSMNRSAKIVFAEDIPND